MLLGHTRFLFFMWHTVDTILLIEYYVHMRYVCVCINNNKKKKKKYTCSMWSGAEIPKVSFVIAKGREEYVPHMYHSLETPQDIICINSYTYHVNHKTKS